MPKQAQAQETEPENETAEGPERMFREGVAMVATLIEEAVAANKRPFFVSQATAAKLTAAFDDLVDTVIDEDGQIDTDAEELETLKEFVKVMSAIK